MKGLKGLASVIVLLGLIVCAPRTNAQIKPQLDKFPFGTQIRPQSVRNNQNTYSKLEQGFNLLGEEKYREAIKVFSEVIKLKPNNEHAYLGRGVSYFYLEDYRKAKADLDKCISIDSSIVYAYLFRGVSNYNLERKQEAISDLQIAANLFQEQGKPELAQQMLEIIEQIKNA